MERSRLFVVSGVPEEIAVGPVTTLLSDDPAVLAIDLLEPERRRTQLGAGALLELELVSEHAARVCQRLRLAFVAIGVHEISKGTEISAVLKTRLFARLPVRDPISPRFLDGGVTDEDAEE